MGIDIKEQLKQIELALLKGLSPQEIISHWAMVQTEFDMMSARCQTLATERDRFYEEKHALKTKLEAASAEKTRLSETINALERQIRSDEIGVMEWRIEKRYAELHIKALTDIISGILSRTALKGEGFFSASGYLPHPSSHSAGNVNATGNVGVSEQVMTPTIGAQR